MAAQMVSHGVSLSDLAGRVTELRAKVKLLSETAWDEVVEMKGARFELAANDLPQIAWGSDRYLLAGNALPSLCSQLDIPGRFVEKCQEKGLHGHGIATLGAFLNHKLSQKPEYKLLARFRKGEGDGSVIRAFCSEGYGKFDNHEALELLFDRLPKGLGEAVGLHTYEAVDDLKGTLLFPDTKVGVVGDSDYYLGVYYKNSEVCRSAFGVAPFLFRSFCTNSAIWGQRDAGGDISIRHYGMMDMERIGTDLSLSLERVEERGPNMLNLLGYARQVPVKDPVAMIAYLSATNALPHTHAKAWREAFAVEPCDNAGAVIDGLTRAAQGYAANWRLPMETLGGELLAPSLSSGQKDVANRWAEYGRGARAFANTKPEKFRRFAGLVDGASNN